LVFIARILYLVYIDDDAILYYYDAGIVFQRQNSANRNHSKTFFSLPDLAMS